MESRAVRKRCWGTAGACLAFVLAASEAAGTSGLGIGGYDAIAFERIAIPADVPTHLASAMVQDGRGFLWIGTQAGLARWDGLAFRVFASDPADPTTLGGSYVRALLAARDGRIWIGTFGGGLSAFDPATETFTRYRHVADDPGSLAHDRVEGLAEDSSGAIWVATSGGLDRLDPPFATGVAAFAHFRHDPNDPSSLADDLVRALLVDRAGRLWVGGRAGLQRLRPEGDFERVGSDPGLSTSLAGDFVERLYEDRRGRIWIGTAEHGAAVLDPATGGVTRLPGRGGGPRGLSHWWIYGFAESEDEVWIATFGGGVDVVDATTLGLVARLRHDPALPSTIGSDRVGSILADRSGVIWIGSWGQGVARHDRSTRPFRALRASPNRPDGLSQSAVVRALPLDDGRVWAGTNGRGIELLDRQGRRLEAHRPDPDDPGALADGAVTCLARGADDTLWVATLDGTLHLRRRGARRFVRIGAEEGLPGGPIRALTFASDGGLWSGSAHGLARVDPRSLEVDTFRTWPGTQSTPAIEAIAEVPGDSGALWVGSDNGLFRFDIGTGGALRFARDATRTDGLPDNWVPDLMVTRDGRLWIGTAAGACRMVSWSGERLVCESIAERIGRRAEPAQQLIEDDAGGVWIGPQLRVDPRDWSARSFAAADGAVFRTIFIASRARDREGRLYFGSPEGLLIVDPAAIAPWTFAPPIVATRLQVDGQARPGAPTLTALTLGPGERGFRLDFAALDLSAPERLRYRTRLEGYERQSIESDAAQRSVAHSGLAPGSYRLVVEGTNRAGMWSAARLELPIEVLPALHQTLAFRGLVLAMLLALAWALHRLRVRQLRARSARLEREVAARTAELATANDDLRTANRRIEEASLTDPLTGLRNRRYLEQTIEADIEIAARAHHSVTPPRDSDLLFLLLDLDHFKSVNDRHGHAAGDAVLVQLGALLHNLFRSSDTLVRWGGEEFLVVARQLDRAEGPELAEKLRAAVAGHPFELPDGAQLGRTVSIGFAPFPFSRAEPRALPWESCVDLADLALYAAKRNGRDGWVGFEPPPDAAAGLARELLSDTPTAVATGRVRILASPALAQPLRWN